MMSIDDNTRMPRRNRAFWEAHTDQWKQSGLSKIAYSKKHDLKPVSFYSWSRKLDHPDPKSSDTAIVPAEFLPVKIERSAENNSDAEHFVRVERAATELILPIDLSAEHIERWLHAIHTLHA